MESLDIGDRVRQLRQKVVAADLELVRALDERGILVFEISTRFMPDLPAIVAAERPPNPSMIVGPSHPAEVDGLISGPRHKSQAALRDMEQVLPVEEFVGLRDNLRPFAWATSCEVV